MDAVDANLTTEQCKPEKIVNWNASGETTHAILLPEHTVADEGSLFTTPVSTIRAGQRNKVGEGKESKVMVKKT